MASASITFVLNRLGELAVKEAALLTGVGDDIRLLRDKLEWLQTFIQEADQERRKGANKFLDLWVRQTRDVAYEVEDVLDEFLRRVDLGKLVLPTWKKWLRYLSDWNTQVSVRHELNVRMDKIKNRLKEISDNVDRYKIEEFHLKASTTSGSNSSLSGVAAWDEDATVVGFKEEIQELKEKLLKGSKARTVVSIVGESGSGKSTLAWEVYDSDAIRKHFGVRVWISVAPQIKDCDILDFIYKRICFLDHDGNNEALQTGKKEMDARQALSKHLWEKRYLVMLDGLVDLSNWNATLEGLPDNGKSSRLMIITRLEDKEATDGGPHVTEVRITKLSQEESNELFQRKVFGSKNSPRSEEWKDIHQVFEDVYKITDGLPLAISVLAGLLRTKKFIEWKDSLAYLKLGKTKKVDRILALGFDDLPSRLKSCFLYFAGMPENVVLKARRLVRLWAAEGFLKAKKGKTMEDVGRGYLKDLIARGLIQLVMQDSHGGVWLVAIHDRLHAFAQSEAQEASFLEVHDNVEILATASVRRMYLQNFLQSYVHMDTSFPKLRSILCHFAEEIRRSSNNSKEEPHQQYTATIDGSLKDHGLYFLPRSKFLRVIDLRGLVVKRVPDAIGDLIHVRYLCLRSKSLDNLPSSIGNLINLQTLDIKKTKVEKLAKEFWHISTLRHILAEQLRLPKSAGVLKNMQTLDGVVCYYPWEKVSPLHNMVNLRYLRISGVKPQHWDTLSDAFMKLESLMYLQLEAAGEISLSIFKKFALRRLQILVLHGEIIPLTAEQEEQYILPNLTRLVLKFTKVNQAIINKVGMLPNLAALVLQQESYEEGVLHLTLESGFRNLTCLVLKDLPNFSKLKLGPMSVPNMKKIIISGCHRDMNILPEGEHPMQNLEQVIVNMSESSKLDNSALGAKVNHVRINNNTDQDMMMDAMQRGGKWRAGMLGGNLYQM